MNVTVTGAAGRLGTATITALLAAGHQVHGTDRNYRKDAPVPIDVANLLDREACYRLVAGSDTLIHLGNHTGVWGVGPQTTFAENCAMNANIIQAAIDVGIRKIIYASSIQVMGGQRRTWMEPVPESRLAYLPADGNMPAHALNMYSLSKLACENMLAALAETEGASTIAIRYPLLISDRAYEHMRRRPWREYDNLDEAFAYLHYADAGELTKATAEADLPGFRVYLPSGPGTIAQRPIAELVRDFYPNVPLRRPLETLTSLVDISGITRDTGWQPRHAAHEATEPAAS